MNNYITIQTSKLKDYANVKILKTDCGLFYAEVSYISKH